MSQALYRKYRSKSLAEIVGQEHITDTLKKALKTDRISHAYLFTGPRGVGKTSIARILAHEINQIPYEDDTSNIDIIEIDAASNNGVEDVRDLREKAYIAPSASKYKVYIIDEVHMLSKAAFNALLKILEEPPAHVVFILATTESSKVPDTIISRTQRYIFRPVEHDKVVEHLSYIAKQEKIKIDQAALELIAEHGEGSFRDSISLLDQLRNIATDSITASTVTTMLGIVPLEAVKNLLYSLQHHDAVVIMQALGELSDQGFQAATISKQLANLLRQGLLDNKPILPVAQTLQLLQRLLEVSGSSEPLRFLEICLLESAAIDTPAVVVPDSKPTPVTPQAAPGQHVAPVEQPIAKVITASISSTENPTTKTPAPAKTASKVEAAPSDTPPSKNVQTVEVNVSGKLDAACWPDVLGALKHKYNTLYGVIKTAQPNFDSDSKLELTFAFAFHQKRINDAKNKKILADTIQQVTGQLVEISCLYDKNIAVRTYPGLPELPAEGSEIVHNVDVLGLNNQPLTSVNSIFGGGEVLPS